MSVGRLQDVVPAVSACGRNAIFVWQGRLLPAARAEQAVVTEDRVKLSSGEVIDGEQCRRILQAAVCDKGFTLLPKRRRHHRQTRFPRLRVRICNGNNAARAKKACPSPVPAQQLSADSLPSRALLTQYVSAARSGPFPVAKAVLPSLFKHKTSTRKVEIVRSR